MMQFSVCNDCGACCREVGCVHYQGNRCPIYDTRPHVCDVGKMAQDMERISGLPAGAFMMVNVTQCREKQKKGDLPLLLEPRPGETWEEYEQRGRN